MSKYKALIDALAGVDGKLGQPSLHSGHVIYAETEEWCSVDINVKLSANKHISGPLARFIKEAANPSTIRALLADLEMAEKALAAIAQQAQECTRSHPHELMSPMCGLRTEIARLTNENERLKRAQQAQPVHQFRRQLCADWYDGHPDHEDGGGPYETRILYATPPAPQPAPVDEREAEIAELRAEVLAWRKQCDRLTHQVICCGVAASHPDATLTTRGAYAGKWNSGQAEEVRKLRAERDALAALQSPAKGQS